MSVFKFKSTCIICNKKFKAEPGAIESHCSGCKGRMNGTNAQISEGDVGRYMETKWVNGAAVIDTHGAAIGKNETVAVYDGEYGFDIRVKNDNADTVHEIVTLKVNKTTPDFPKCHSFYLHSGYAGSYYGKIPLKAGDVVSVETGKLTLFEFSLYKNRPFSTVYGMPLTDPVKFSGGAYVRRGEYMIVYSNNNYFDRKPIYDFLPAGFDYDMNSLTFIPTDDNKVKMQVRVKGWVNFTGAFQMSETIKFEPPKEDLSAYSISGQFTINTPGTYEINGRKITLHDGSISVELNNSDVNEDGTIKNPVKLQEKEQM